jgi:6-phosphogluconolactonase (cycloisomerase 2 family)
LLTDSSGNGWNGNVLAFKQDGILTSFGEQFIYGDKYGPRQIAFKKNLMVSVYSYILGKNTE